MSHKSLQTINTFYHLLVLVIAIAIFFIGIKYNAALIIFIPMVLVAGMGSKWVINDNGRLDLVDC